MAYGIKYCRKCGSPMHKAGWAWSGKRQVQRWRCPRCGATTIHPLSSPRTRRQVTKHRIDGVRVVRVGASRSQRS